MCAGGGRDTCILYNKPYSKNACIGYWPTDENETVGAMTFIWSGVMRCGILSLPDYRSRHIVLIYISAIAVPGDTVLVVQ